MSRVRGCVVVFFAVVAFSAVVAGSAQAGWLVLGSLLVGSAAAAKSTFIHETTLIGFKSGTEEVKIECPTSLEIAGGTISEPDKFLATSVVFAGCQVEPAGNCSLEPSPASIDTLPVEGLVTLDGVLAAKAKVKPENTSKLFATFKLKGASCSLSGKVAVTGEASLLGTQSQGESLWQLDKAFEEKTGELEIGSGPATISGAALAKLENDMPWTFR
jgi:hypothetical protein